MNTAFMLLARYDGKPVIPVEDVCRDFFTHLTPVQLLRKSLEIGLPVVKIEGSKRAARGVHLNDLAAYIDRQADEARRDCEKLAKTA